MDNERKDQPTKMDVFFRGDLVAGEKLVDVRERLKNLFKANDEQLQRMFSGRPIAIRRGLDSATATQYQEALLKAGALVELKPAKAVAEPTERVSGAQSPAQTQGQQFSEQTPKPIQQTAPQQVEENASQSGEAGSEGKTEDAAFTVAPIGADMLRDEDRAIVEATEVDISALAMEELEGDILQDSEKRHVEPADIDTSHLSVEALPPK